MVLCLTLAQSQTLCAHSQQTYPEECCGVLVGQWVGGDGIVVEVVAMDNVWGQGEAGDLASIADRDGTDRRRNFALDPQAFLQVQRTARDRHQQIIGIYHSHPDHPAVPSEFDRAIAWPIYHYLILAIDQGERVMMKNWQLDDEGKFQPIPLHIANP